MNDTLNPVTSPTTTPTSPGLMTVSRLLERLQEETQELTWAEGYADGSSDNGKGVLACNWNTEALLSRSCRADKHLQAAKSRGNQLARYLYGGTSDFWQGRPMPKTRSMFPALTREALRIAREAEQLALQRWNEKAARIGEILERGFSLEWSDMGSVCGGCNRWIWTAPTDFCFHPDYLLANGDIICGGCVRADIALYVQDHLDQAERLLMDLAECPFATNLNITATWQAVEELEDDRLTVATADQAVLSTLETFHWPGIQHEGAVVFVTPDDDEPVALALALLNGEAV